MSIPQVIVVAGPTATGKTRLGILLAQHFGGEIVSADSMQVYRRMDIGTAKATPEERAAVKHHMLDVAEPWENYSVSRYVEDASCCCEEILSRGRLPIIVGGTGLYIDSLLSGRDFAGREEGEESLRILLNARWEAEGGEALLEELASFDPDRAAKLHPGDRRRIVRAIEIYRLTGETISAHDQRTRSLPPRFEAARIHLNFRSRSDLYSRINARVDTMVESGLFDEVLSLLAEGVPQDCTSMQAIGYKEAASALRGDISRDEAVSMIKLNSRRYAKRQLTWFSRSEDALNINWESTPDYTAALRLSSEFLSARGLSASR